MRLRNPRLLPLFAAVLFVVSIGAAIGIAHSLSSRTYWVEHTLVVQNAIIDLRSSLQDAEAGQRAYLLTGETQYLDPYTRSVVALGGEIAQLEIATADNARQQDAVTELRSVVRRRLALLADGIDKRRAGDMVAALANVRRGTGTALMRQALGIIGDMRGTEARLLTQRKASAARLSRALLAAIATSGLLAACFIGLWLRGLRAHARSLERGRERLREANALLESKVAERTAELRDTNQEIQRFAYIVSHDLRAPLVNIMGFTSEIDVVRESIRAALVEHHEAEAIDRELAEALGFIKAAIGKMDRLIGAILKISRDGRRALRPERLDVTALVRSLADAQHHQAEAIGAAVIVNTLPNITADRLAIEQIFGNLIDTAIKYLDPSRPGRIEIAGRIAGPLARYEVRDNGRGIAPADRERVFELFRRAGAIDKPGEGIGLAHVRALVRAMAGRIEIVDGDGAGTVFQVTLPREPLAV